MPAQINVNQRASVTAWKGTVTKDNHLYGLFQSNPQRATDVMMTLMSSMHMATLDTFLSSLPVREYDDDTELFWDLATSSRRNIPLVECRRADGTPVSLDSEDLSNVGAGREPFYLVFATDWFAIGNVIWGERNELYPIYVKEDPVQEGTNTVYFCEAFGADVAGGIPVEELISGKRFSIGYNPVENNLSRKVGDIHFSSPIHMSSNFQHVRMSTKVGGKELGGRLAANIPVSKMENGKLVTKMAKSWMFNVTWQLEQEWEWCKNNSLNRGVNTVMENGEVSNFGLSGLPNKQGAGFRRQMETGNVKYYTKFKLGLIEDAIYNLSIGKLDFAKRKFTVHAGERGIILINKEAKKEMSGWLPLYGGASSVPYISKGPSTNFAPNGVTIADHQVTRWIAANGVEVDLVVDSEKDDIQTNKIMHPLGGTAESYRFDICYAADEEQPNVQKCVVKNMPERRGYQWGPFYNPFTGESNNSSASFDEDAAVAHYKATQGIIIYDPTRCISLIPALLRG